MAESNYTLSRGLSLSVPVSDADKLIKAADGDAALLYIHILRGGGQLSTDMAAKELGMSGDRISAAVESLRSMGLLEKSERKLQPAAELPEYRAEDLTSRTISGDGFQAVVSETQRIFGRMLSSSELKTLFGIYDYLSLPPEVMLLLINYCVEECRETYGEGRLPTMRTVEKEGFVWSERELLTLELAEEYIRKRRESKKMASKYCEILNIKGRAPSSSEKKYLNSWAEMGFLPEAVEIAYDRTVIQTGKLAWSYMNKILLSWHEKGLHSPEEIVRGDSFGGKKTPVSVSSENGSSSSDEFEKMQKLLERINNS